MLWFDTEDYILPAADDAALRLAEFLSGEAVRATFKMVGEKARVLESRGRRDVIEAIGRHEVGYHTDFHSMHPTPAEYLSGLGWDDGVAEFDRRERKGFEDVRRIFGAAPSCYGQPGCSWGPQAYGAMREWGVGVYLDAGSHVDVDGRPCFYCRALNLLKLAHTIRTELEKPSDLAGAKERFRAARERLLADGGGVVSVYYHPCEFVHREFWDAVNFARGANPPRVRWELPRVKTPAAVETAFGNFEGFVRFVKSFPDTEFVTASEAAALYADRASGRMFVREEVGGIAERVGEAVGFQVHDGYSLSASEVFAVLNEFASAGLDSSVVLKETPLGPTGSLPRQAAPFTVDRHQFARTVFDVADHLRRHGRIPSSVWLGSRPVPPEAFLRTLARDVLNAVRGRPLSRKVQVKPARLEAAKYVADDSPGLWGWKVFPPGFRAPAMMDLAKKQAWTLKPALLNQS